MKTGAGAGTSTRAALWEQRFSTILARQPRSLLLVILLAAATIAITIDYAGRMSRTMPVSAVRSLPAVRPLPPLFDSIEERTFRYFWDNADPETGLIPDRYPTPS
ncbi:MAG TPA: hypothetical protein VLN59_14760, partial [Burkholderiales bacterium]|nr:hypothetical protein [Burkholderiales bacterium]